ncbi:MAG: NTP transferase domain-containing protein [Candidatus Zixiibacteriota bacterium]|nr:MAG: NTP transferase domain-containing protein [candidate division Zixibacteria bacterium]
MKVIIPVAGAGTRLWPHTFTVPKSLICVAGKPILSHILDPLIGLKPEEIVFVIGHLGEQIVDFVRKNYALKSRFVEQSDLLGLGFAVHLALEKMDSGPVMVILGDTIARMNFEQFISNSGNTIGLKEVKDPRRFGVAVVDDEKVLALQEKPEHPKSNLAVVGVYYFEDSDVLKKHLDKVIILGKKTGGEIQLTDALEYMIRDGHAFKPVLVDGWYDCGKRETLLETNRILLSESSEVSNYPGSVIVPPVYIAPRAVVEESIIGPYVSIADNAKIHRSIIKDSIICDGASIEYSLLDESIIGQKAVVRGTYSRLNVGELSDIGYF